MSPDKIIRAWKDEDYRLGLNSKERALLPENPAGIIELSDDDLKVANGGTDEYAGTTTTTVTLPISFAISCAPSCSDTVWKGTCAFATVGCCGRPPCEGQLY